MAVHIAPLVLHVRGFDDGIDINVPLYMMRASYNYHMVVLINDLGIARLEGLDDKFTHKDRRELAHKLTAYGVIRAEWRHHGIEKHHNLVHGWVS